MANSRETGGNTFELSGRPCFNLDLLDPTNRFFLAGYPYSPSQEDKAHKVSPLSFQ